MAVNNKLDAKRLREILEYDDKSGKFTWLVESRTGFHNSVVNHLAGDEAGTPRKVDGRIVIRVDGKLYLRYRLAWLWMFGKWPSKEIDHLDGNPTNDRIENLREATRALNQQNIRRPTKSKKSSAYLGVFANKPGRSKPWKAAICHKGKQISLGSFNTEEEAHCAYLSAKRRIHEGCTI